DEVADLAISTASSSPILQQYLLPPGSGNKFHEARTLQQQDLPPGSFRYQTMTDNAGFEFVAELVASLSSSDKTGEQRYAVDIVFRMVTAGGEPMKRALIEEGCIPALMVPMEDNGTDGHGGLAARCFRELREYEILMGRGKCDHWVRIKKEWESQDRFAKETEAAYAANAARSAGGNGAVASGAGGKTGKAGKSKNGKSASTNTDEKGKKKKGSAKKSSAPHSRKGSIGSFDLLSGTPNGSAGGLDVDNNASSRLYSKKGLAVCDLPDNSKTI
ncbi:hypothetical protein HDU76_008175, partial [Blyttiomyces sp. JEL0837]